METALKTTKDNMGVTYFVWTLMCIVCMAVMLIFASRKTIVIEDTTQIHADSGTEKAAAETESSLTLRKSFGVEGSFCIPLPKGMRAENVVIENRYLEKELCLHLDGDVMDFYENSEISGDISPVLKGTVQKQKDGTFVTLKMNQIYEFKSTLEANSLTIVWYEPREVYQHIVVLDPIYTAEESQMTQETTDDISLRVAKAVLNKVNDQGVKLYLTRLEHQGTTNENVLDILDEVDADFYIRISLARDESQASYGIQGIYNEEYFIPEFGNPELADLLTKEVTLAASNRALGLEQADAGSILKQVNIPAAEIVLGYLSNPKESYLLQQEDYCEKLAEGIAKALHEATADR